MSLRGSSFFESVQALTSGEAELILTLHFMDMTS